MAYDVKISLITWWILIIIFIFLWYRNQKYDRVISVFVFSLALIQLVEYGIHSSANPNQSGKAIFIILWLQVFLLSLAVFIFLRTSQAQHKDGNIDALKFISLFTLIIFGVIFALVIVYTLFNIDNLNCHVDKEGKMNWKDDQGKDILGYWWIVYFIGILLPLFLLLAYYEWSDIGLAVLIAYTAFVAALALRKYKTEDFGSNWSYLAAGFAFIAWLTGMFFDNSTTPEGQKV